MKAVTDRAMPTNHNRIIGIILGKTNYVYFEILPSFEFTISYLRVNVDFTQPPSAAKPPPAICRILRRPERGIHPLDDARVPHPSQFVLQMFLSKSFLHIASTLETETRTLMGLPLATTGEVWVLTMTSFPK